MKKNDIFFLFEWGRMETYFLRHCQYRNKKKSNNLFYALEYSEVLFYVRVISFWEHAHSGFIIRAHYRVIEKEK